MNISRKKYTKKLSFREMWNLYKLLGASPIQENYVIDEVLNIMNKISTKTFKETLYLLEIDSKGLSGIEIGKLFIRGLSINRFFEFAEIIGKFNGSPK